MGNFVCKGSYAQQMITNANNMQQYVKNTTNNTWNRGVVSLNPVNSCRSFIRRATQPHNAVLLNVRGEWVYNPYYNNPLQTISYTSNEFGDNTSSDTPYICNRCVINVQKFSDFKRTLTGKWLTDAGYTCGAVTKPLPQPDNGAAISAITVLLNDDNTYKPLGRSLYDDNIYDDYLVPISIYYYNEEGAQISNIVNIIDGFCTPFYVWNYNNKWWNIYRATKQGVQVTPDVVIYNGNIFNMPRHNNWGEKWGLIREVGGSTAGLYTIDSITDRTNPYITIYCNNITQVPFLPSIGKQGICEAYTFSIFKDFSDIQRWYIDFGIKAYESYADLQIDNFPDNLDQDIGFPDNNNPDNIDSLPSNKSDPTEFSIPDISPESAYKLYALNFPMYRKTKQQLISQDFFTAIKNFFTNPLESILGCLIFPFDFLNHSEISLLVQDKISVINYDIPDIDCYSVLPQYPFYNFNLGSAYIQAYYGNFLDYQAKYTLYVPFCGSIDLDSSNVVNHTIYLRAVISLLSGGGTVYITNDEDKLLGTINGNFGANLSFNSSNYAQTLQTSIMSALPSGIAALANPTASLEMVGKFWANMLLTPQHNGLKGTIDTNTNFGGICTAFLRASLPIPSNPSNYNRLAGISSQIYQKIGNLPDGVFVSFSDISVSTLTCTAAEKDMIKNLLKTGIYI